MNLQKLLYETGILQPPGKQVASLTKVDPLTEAVIKTFSIEIKEASEDGGQITISTPVLDRDSDRVYPMGADITAYLLNPVVQWAHNYREIFATIGRTNELTLSEQKIDADFSLRPSANEHDPQVIVRLLWGGQWVKAASIGFRPFWSQVVSNEEGGWDFHLWELLEWSLVPIPANQQALRLATELIKPKSQLLNPDDLRGLELIELSQLVPLYHALQRIFTEANMLASPPSKDEGDSDTAGILTTDDNAANTEVITTDETDQQTSKLDLEEVLAGLKETVSLMQSNL